MVLPLQSVLDALRPVISDETEDFLMETLEDMEHFR